MTTSQMESSWLERLEPEFKQPYMKNLEAFLGSEMAAKKVVYPPLDKVFNAFCQSRFDDVKVVIMGQDPYHNPRQAHGLSFSVPRGVQAPPSLQNIFKEMEADLGLSPPTHGCLEGWARQGVLLLNATLTVRENEPKSHYGQGWEQLTDRAVQLLAERKDPLVFILWGKSALDKFRHVSPEGKPTHHLILTSPHPSPLSAYAGFFGCRHFSQTNEFLKQVGKTPIDWKIVS
jgi:uracil-DNA glycosylase